MEETIDQEEAQQVPPVDFINYLANLVETGRLYLEGIPNPETEEVVINLPLVKHIIDTIEMLEAKTKGNLTAPEANFLSNTLYELRMGYIRVVSSQEAAAQEGSTVEEAEAEAPADKTEEPP
ncbi:DUF1844 domain-containing protein [Candidatus Poribacteria bacterium]|nr:DUF1844 domain-containing protein [Candidatus Poribacteria bacterium]MYK92842.1 DUF1844 domain-containing protein [Candidatus Poribacteria bacterium]